MNKPSSPMFDAGWSITEESATAELTDATRALIRSIRRADAPAEDLERATALVSEATALLDPHRIDRMPMQGRIGEGGPMWPSAEPRPSRFFPWSPVVGPLNPLAPPVELTFDGTRMHGTTRLAAPYNGPPGMVHGGIIALVFDELLGATNVCLGLGGFTGTLTVRYERPTPVDRDLVLEGWLDRTEGRKVFTGGTITHDGLVTARAEGIFIVATAPEERERP